MQLWLHTVFPKNARLARAFLFLLFAAMPSIQSLTVTFSTWPLANFHLEMHDF